MMEVCKILGIDRVDMSDRKIVIEEQHGSNANFLVQSVLSNALKKKESVCLVLCHNTIGHYHNIGVRFGYDLLKLIEMGQVRVVDLMKIVLNDIDNTCNNVPTKGMIIPNVTCTTYPEIAERLAVQIKEKCDDAERRNSPIILIIEDINHLLDLGLSVRDTIFFVRCVETYINMRPKSLLCILAHTYGKKNSECSDTDMIVNALKYESDLCVTTEPLKTGHSNDASGKLIVHWTVNAVRAMYNWPERMTYLFKLLDWQVKISTPSAMS
ncbi:hypothetical protein X777_04545 [Ooceraea biroi]|nr:hypothetical protein X777_04545 [Ooceraea biroi]